MLLAGIPPSAAQEKLFGGWHMYDGRCLSLAAGGGTSAVCRLWTIKPQTLPSRFFLCLAADLTLRLE